MHALILAVALVIAVPGVAHAQADDLDPRVLIMPVEGAPPAALDGLETEIADAMARGAARLTPTVTRATATLEDTAVIVGCEPSEPRCADAVAAALNVDQLLIAAIHAEGDDAGIEVTAVTRESEPVRQTFRIRAASRGEDLAGLEEAIPAMLEAGEARKREEVVKPPPDPDPPPPPPPPPAPRRSPAPLIVAGAGAALVIAGGVFWGLASLTQGEIDDAPTDTAADLERLADLEDRASLRANVGNVLIAGGAVVAVAGVTWYLLAGPGERRDERVQAGPLLVPGGGGIAIGGAW